MTMNLAILQAVRNASAELALDALLEALRRDEIHVNFDVNTDEQYVEIALNYGYEGNVSHYRHSLTNRER